MKIDLEKLNKKMEMMEMNVNETLGQLMTDKIKVMSWGARNWTNVENKALAFRVSGFIHKGYVVIMLNANDLYDIDLISVRGKIVKSITDIYCDVLVDVIDNAIEKTKKFYK